MVSKAAQLLEVAQLTGQLDQLVARGGVALIGKAAQLVKVALLASQLDKLVSRIPVAAVGTFPQESQIRFLHDARTYETDSVEMR